MAPSPCWDLKLSNEGSFVEIRQETTKLGRKVWKKSLESRRADLEFLRADLEPLQADLETLRADLETLRADLETLRAESIDHNIMQISAPFCFGCGRHMERSFAGQEPHSIQVRLHCSVSEFWSHCNVLQELADSGLSFLR